MQFCTQCGQKIEEGGECPNCSHENSGPVSKNQRKGMNKIVIGAITLVMLVVGGFIFIYQSPDKKANELFVEAAALVQSVQEVQEESYLDAYNSGKAAIAALDTILSKYPETDLAVDISRGEAKIGPYSSSELKEIVSELSPKAEAERSPLAAAYYIASNSENYSYDKYIELVTIAQRYAKIGDYDTVEGILAEIQEMSRYVEDEMDRSEILTETAICYAYAKQFEKALQVVETIGDEEYPIFTIIAWGFIATELAENGHQDQAAEVLSKTFGLYSGNDDRFLKAWASGVMAGGYAKTGHKNKALEMLSESVYTIKNSNIDSAAFRLVAYGYSQIGEYEKALEVITALEPQSKQWPLSIVIRELEKNDQDRVSELLPQVLSSADTISDVSERLITKAEIAGSYAKFGKKDKAMEILTNSLDELMEDQYTTDKELPLAVIAGSYAEAEEKDKALEIAYLALQEIQKITDDISQARGLSKLGYEMAERDLQTNEEMQVLLHSIINALVLDAA